MAGAAAWAGALRGYTTAQRAAGRAPGTIRLRRHYLGNLAEQIANPWDATTETLQQYLSRDGWEPETRKSARSALRSFYGWGHRAGHVVADPSADLDSVKVPPATPRPTPEDVVQAALATAAWRERLMVMLAAYGGLRCREIRLVHRRDLVGDVLRVHGKGGKIRDVPIVSAVLLAELQRLDGWAFPNQHGDPMTAGHVTRLISRTLHDDWTAHTLRHRMGTTAYAGTRDLLAVQQLLGHSRPETTQRYVKLPDDAVRAAARAASAA